MSELDLWHMSRALELARRGEGWVEPNPMVGCVVARGDEVVGEGWHKKYGGPHAEVEALAAAGARGQGGAMYVTLEPCRHFGKTPPCTRAIIAAGISRVVCAQEDPYAEVAGRGIAELRAAGVEVQVGLMERDARELNAPYLKLATTGRPWVIAKWAMSLDGRIATAAGESQWISGPESREIVAGLRGRVDGIVVGKGTMLADDPLLTARPPGQRTAARVVLDRRGETPVTSQLVRTARESAVIVAAGEGAPASNRERLEGLGCEVLALPDRDVGEHWEALLNELGRRRFTNLLVEGGSRVLGTLFDLNQIDEVHVFIAPKLIGGQGALGPIGGEGRGKLAEALRLREPRWQKAGEEMYVTGRCER